MTKTSRYERGIECLSELQNEVAGVLWKGSALPKFDGSRICVCFLKARCGLHKRGVDLGCCKKDSVHQNLVSIEPQEVSG